MGANRAQMGVEMTPEMSGAVRVWAEYIALAGLLVKCLAGLSGRGRDDDEVIEAHETVLAALGDADRVRTIACVTERNLRDQMTVEQAQALAEEAELRRLHGRRN